MWPCVCVGLAFLLSSQHALPGLRPEFKETALFFHRGGLSSSVLKEKEGCFHKALAAALLQSTHHIPGSSRPQLCPALKGGPAWDPARAGWALQAVGPAGSPAGAVDLVPSTPVLSWPSTPWRPGLWGATSPCAFLQSRTRRCPGLSGLVGGALFCCRPPSPWEDL